MSVDPLRSWAKPGVPLHAFSRVQARREAARRARILAVTCRDPRVAAGWAQHAARLDAEAEALAEGDVHG